jgi:hypothetical protein
MPANNIDSIYIEQIANVISNERGIFREIISVARHKTAAEGTTKVSSTQQYKYVV